MAQLPVSKGQARRYANLRDYFEDYIDARCFSAEMFYGFREAFDAWFHEVIQEAKKSGDHIFEPLPEGNESIQDVILDQETMIWAEVKRRMNDTLKAV